MKRREWSYWCPTPTQHELNPERLVLLCSAKGTVLLVDSKTGEKRGYMSCRVHFERNTVLFLSYLRGRGDRARWSSSFTPLAGGTMAVKGRFSCGGRSWSSEQVSSGFPDGDWRWGGGASGVYLGRAGANPSSGAGAAAMTGEAQRWVRTGIGLRRGNPWVMHP